MEEKQHCAAGASCRRSCFMYGAVPFLVGAAAALLFGWGVFPDLLYSKQQQPLFFNHTVHVKDAGATCMDCHSFRADGSFTGFPTIETCAECHQDILTAEPDDKTGALEKAAYNAEKTLVEDYIRNGKHAPWIAHQRQPDNVFFSHAAHNKVCFTCHLTMKGEINLGTPDDPQRLCMTCHPSVAELSSNPAVDENILTGYSRTTMKMWQCESCHAKHLETGQTTASNACFVCHK